MTRQPDVAPTPDDGGPGRPDTAAVTDGRPSLTDLSIARVAVANALSGGGNLEEAAERLAVTVSLYLSRQRELTGTPRIDVPATAWDVPMRDWAAEDVTVTEVVSAIRGGDDDDPVTVTHSGNGRPLRIGGIRVAGGHVDIVVDEAEPDQAAKDAGDAGLAAAITSALTMFRPVARFGRGDWQPGTGFAAEAGSWVFNDSTGGIDPAGLVCRTVTLTTASGRIFERATVAAFDDSRGTLSLHGGQFLRDGIQAESSWATVRVSDILSGWVHREPQS